MASGESQGNKRDAAVAQQPKSPTVRKSQSLQDQQFEERQRFAERLVQDLREAGYSCELGEDGPARALKPLN
jgi:hypothetical protein